MAKQQIIGPTKYHTFAYKLVVIQFVVVIILSLIGWPFGGLKVGLSMFAGGMAVVLPTTYFAYRLFTKFHTRNVKQQMRNFYASEAIKIALSVILALIMITQLPLAVLPFFIGFIGAQLGLWVAPLFIKGLMDQQKK